MCSKCQHLCTTCTLFRYENYFEGLCKIQPSELESLPCQICGAASFLYTLKFINSPLPEKMNIMEGLWRSQFQNWKFETKLMPYLSKNVWNILTFVNISTPLKMEKILKALELALQFMILAWSYCQLFLLRPCRMMQHKTVFVLGLTAWADEFYLGELCKNLSLGLEFYFSANILCSACAEMCSTPEVWV